MNQTADQFTRAPQQYGLLDGTSEIVLGLACLLFSASMWLATQFTVTWQWLAAMLGGCGLLWVISTFGTRYIRRKLVYTRSGYMKTRRQPWKPVLLAASACAISGIASLAFSRTPKSMIPLLVSLAISAAFLAGSLIKGVRRFAAYAVLSSAWGVLVYLLKLGMRSGMTSYYLLLGITLILAGVWTMLSYVRHTPQHAPEAE